MSGNGVVPREVAAKVLAKLRTPERRTADEQRAGTEAMKQQLRDLRRALAERRRGRGGRSAPAGEIDKDQRLIAEVEDLEATLPERAGEQEKLDGLREIAEAEISPDVWREFAHRMRCGAGEAADGIVAAFGALDAEIERYAAWFEASGGRDGQPVVPIWGGGAEALLREARRRIENVTAGLPRTGDVQLAPLLAPPVSILLRAAVDLSGTTPDGNEILVEAGATFRAPPPVARALVGQRHATVHLRHVEGDWGLSRDQWRAARELPKLPPEPPPPPDHYAADQIEARAKRAAEERASREAREEAGIRSWLGLGPRS